MFLFSFLRDRYINNNEQIISVGSGRGDLEQIWFKDKIKCRVRSPNEWTDEKVKKNDYETVD
jgi:hypothetical protein